MTLPAQLRSCQLRGGTSHVLLDRAEEELGQQFPQDYRNVMLVSDGLEGFLSEDAYLILWQSSDLPSLNAGYAVREFLPGVTLVGTDGGDVAYGFREKDGRFEYVSVPLVGMEPTAVSVVGDTFLGLLERLERA